MPVCVGTGIRHALSPQVTHGQDSIVLRAVWKDTLRPAGGARAGFREAGPSAGPYSVRRDELGGDGGKRAGTASLSGAWGHGDGRD